MKVSIENPDANAFQNCDLHVTLGHAPRPYKFHSWRYSLLFTGGD